MNEARWDAIADSFERGELVPANGMEAWRDKALEEALLIRSVLPGNVETLVEVGCGVGRLTPYLALTFPRVIAIDTSSQCRRLTMIATVYSNNVVVCSPDEVPSIGEPDAAVVWGNLFDEDWSDQDAIDYLWQLLGAVPLVLTQSNRALLAVVGHTIRSGPDWLLQQGQRTA